MGGSYRKPTPEMFDKQTKLSKAEIEKQIKETEKLVKEVEGEDDRSYGHESAAMKKKLL